ncbi:AraC family transcriptional regulator [Maricurvus nonylphenolicus]|uniref:AraC family transcriptional regulator n=1 Tax=Maricurvus nonylphenolicus TaxID=1008307 RepID=UPI0036F1B278
MIDWQRLRDTAGVSILLEVGAELGLSQDQCLSGTQIVADELENPLASISVWQELTLIRNIQEFRGSDEQLGLMVAKHCIASAMGMFGQALATSDNLQQVWELMQRYQLLGLAFSRFEFSTTKKQLCLTLHDFEMPADCQRFCEERGMGACLALFSDLIGDTLVPKAVTMRLPPPSEPAIYHDFFGVDVQFNAAQTTIIFDRAIENTPLPNANRKLHLASIRYCDEVIESQITPMTYAGRVRSILEEQNLKLDLEEVAQQFGISSRQLRRQLTKEGVSFRELQLTLKFGRAQALLESGMSVSQVALSLGYADLASFSRAFKKRVGHSPSFFSDRAHPTSPKV